MSYSRAKDTAPLPAVFSWPSGFSQMRIPYVIDNQSHRLADILGGLLREHQGRRWTWRPRTLRSEGSVLSGTACSASATSGFILGAEPTSGEQIGLRPDSGVIERT